MERKNDPISPIKVWLFPIVVTILSTVIWKDVTELKSDVKALLAQSNIDKTRIDALERQIDILNQKSLGAQQPSNKQTAYFYGSKEFILTNQKKKKQVRYF